MKPAHKQRGEAPLQLEWVHVAGGGLRAYLPVGIGTLDPADLRRLSTVSRLRGPMFGAVRPSIGADALFVDESAPGVWVAATTDFNTMRTVQSVAEGKLYIEALFELQRDKLIPRD